MGDFFNTVHEITTTMFVIVSVVFVLDHDDKEEEEEEDDDDDDDNDDDNDDDDDDNDNDDDDDDDDDDDGNVTIIGSMIDDTHGKMLPTELFGYHLTVTSNALDVAKSTSRAARRHYHGEMLSGRSRHGVRQ